MGHHQADAEPAHAPPVPAPAPAAGLPVAAAGPLTPATVLALQRSAGNVAVAAMIARQTPPTTPKEGPLTPGEITVKGGDPRPQGAWGMTAKVENDRLYLESPEVSFDAELDVPEPPEKRKVPSTTVGFIQTVESADRQGIYTSDGTPGGTPVVTKHLSAKGKRDVQTNMVVDASGNVQVDPSGKPVQLEKAPPPWYDNPSYLDEQQRRTTVSTRDRTKTSFPLEIVHAGKKGKLAKTAGADKFQMAVSAKPGDAPATSLKSMDWETPWDSTIDPATHKVTKTGAVWIHPSDVPLGDQKEPTGAVNKEAIDWTAVKTVADAKALGPGRCLGLLLLARDFDAESYEVMATALRELNPVLGADVSIGDGNPQTVTIDAEGARGVHTRSAVTPGVAVWRLLDFFDPNDLQQGTEIKLSVRGPKGGSAQKSWGFPFAGGVTVSVDDITVSWRLGGSTMGPTAPAAGVARPAGPPPAP